MSKFQWSVLALLVLIACGVFAGMGIAALYLFGTQQPQQQVAAQPTGPPETTDTPEATKTPEATPPPSPFPPGSIPVTRQQIVDRFPEFIWDTRDYKDGTHKTEGALPDGSMRIKLFSAEDIEDLTEVSFYFHFPHDAYYLEHIDDDPKFKYGYNTMMRFQTVILPEWDSDEWVWSNLQNFPEPLAPWEIDETTVQQGVKVWIGAGDQSETEYSVVFGVWE